MSETFHKEIITTHINADFDALSSMVAAKKLYPDATIVFPGSQEKNLRNFFIHSVSYLFSFAKAKQIDLDKVERLILVDTRQRDRIGKFSEIVDRKGLDIHIYDHHPPTNNDIKGTMEVIKPLGSTTTILAQIIKEKDIMLNPDEATVMLLGIHEDTGSFTFSSTTPDDHMVAAWLTEHGADQNILAGLLTRELTAEQVWILNDLTKSAVKSVINGVEVVTAKVIREEYIGDFAVLVHKFMDMENLQVLFALAQMEDKIYLVGRSRIEAVNVAEIALEFGGGGHPQAASATISKKTIIQVERGLQKLLKERIIPVKRAKDMMTSPVIHVLPDRSVKDASTLMTRYNINVLVVVNKKGVLEGYITRQIMEKAVFFNLGHIPVREYMNIDFHTVTPDAPLSEVQELIIKNNLRILPVLKEGSLVGVITRTDLMNILVGGPVINDYLYDPSHNAHFVKNKNLAPVLKEKLPDGIISIFREFGVCADRLGFNAYLVGGLVRDILLKRDNFDVDIVVEGDGIVFACEFAKDHDVRVRSHKKFGTAVLIFPDGFKVDVATARMEYYETPAAPPTVETSSLKMDLYRRDFSINTLAVKLNSGNYGDLIDYFGGQKDIKEKVIRVLHNLSFVEDPTRVFRAVRFEQRFGFRIGRLTLSLIQNAVNINCFKDLSGRRLFIEIKLLLMENDPLKAIQRLHQLELINFISPHIVYNGNLLKLMGNINDVVSWFDLLFLDEPCSKWKIYWFGLTSDLSPDQYAGLSERLMMNDLECQRMSAHRNDSIKLLDSLYRVESDDNYSIYTLLSQYDTEFLLFVMAKANNEKIKKVISNYFTRLKRISISLKGRDLKNMGFEPGPLYKKIFESLLEARLKNTVNSKKEELEFVKARFLNQAVE
ncbi:MAG: CBS domain-containing protein [Deltaproteobacteria bacterium]|nr:CBS domain-containing protein [Deltaproteobacteria bacterium]